jgi:hypothetical protein
MSDDNKSGEDKSAPGSLMDVEFETDTEKSGMREQGQHPAHHQQQEEERQEREGGRPDYLPEQFWDAEAGQPRVEALAKSYSEMRTAYNKAKNGEAPDLPETPDAYLDGFELPREMGEGDDKTTLENVKEFGTDDPAMVAAASAAKAAGLTKEQFAQFTSMFLHGIDGHLGSLAEGSAIDVEAELQKLGGKEKAAPLMVANKAFLDRLSKSGTLNEEEVAWTKQFAATATGVSVLNKLRQMTGEKAIPVNAATLSGSGAKSEGEIQQMMADPRYRQDGPVGDEYREMVRGEIARMNEFRGRG